MVQYIQVLRCIAALAVVIHHVQTFTNIRLDAPHIGYLGRAGVDMFFVISGFVMVHTTRKGGRGVIQFWTDRAVRIVPMYWLAIALLVAAASAGFYLADFSKISVADVIEDLFFIPHYRADGDPYPIVNVGWTLTFEMYFYFLFALTFWMRSQVKALLALSAYFLATWLAVKQIHPHLLAFNMLSQPITLEFVAGGVLALLYRQKDPLPVGLRPWVGWALIGVGCAALIAAAFSVGSEANKDFALRTIAFGAPSVLIVGGVLELEKTRRKETAGWLMLLGAASYAIYLFHYPVANVVVLGAELMFGNHTSILVALTAGIVATVVVTLMGIAIHLKLEKPATAALKDAFGALGRRRAAKPA